MEIRTKAGLIQAAVSAVVLAVLMQPAFILGYGDYVWLLFMALPLFFALGANVRGVWSLALCFAVGQGWALLLGFTIGALSGPLGQALGSITAGIVVIFPMLLVHATLLQRTFLGNVPALFTGMALTFFATNVVPPDGSTFTPLHVTGLFLYGLVLAVTIVVLGGRLCGVVLGKDWRTRLGEEPSSEQAPTG